MRRVHVLLALGMLLFAVAGCGSSKAASGGGQAAYPAPKRGYIVYWDQNEEQDYYASAGHQLGQLIPPWDPNGQMCLLNDGTGRFTVGYNPTVPAQHNPGGKKPYKQPPIGQELIDRHGHWTGQTLYTAGPYRAPKNHALTGKAIGGDVPPDADGGFNSRSTFTGCAVDHHHNVLANDIGTAQGDFPVPDDGRLIMWFAPRYRTFCIVDGPTSGGIGPHHVDGHGGLRQPGTMAVTANGDILLPEAGAPSGLGGTVTRYDHRSLPTSAKQCPGGLYPKAKLHTSVWFKGTSSFLPFPLGVARDGHCGCWAVDSAFGDPAVAWLDDHGKPVAHHPTIPGENITEIGKNPNGYNPFGLAVAPDGSLYLVDIHITCKGTLTGCGPQNGGGRILRFTFHHGKASGPQVVDDNFSFPTSVTICVPSKQACPWPRRNYGKPNGTTAAEKGE